MIKQRIRSAFSTLLVICCLAGCGGSASPSAPSAPADGGAKTKDTLIVAMANEPTTLDPYGKNDSTSAIYKMAIYDTLFALGDDGVAQASIAKSWEYKDDKTLEIKLRDDVVFHDGTKMTAEDVMYSIQKTYESSYLNPFVNKIDLENTTIDDDYTITLRMVKPSGALLNCLCYVYIVPKAYHEKLGNDGFAAAPIASGPFIYKEWVHGDRVDYTVNKNYWGQVASAENLVIRTVAESANRTIEIESGGVDIAMSISANDLPNLEANPDLKVVRAASWNNCFIGMNCQKEPFTDVRVRQAISAAIDTASIVKAVYGDTGSVAKGPISPAIWGYNDDLKDHVYDPDLARDLLKQAGYEEGQLSVTISVSDTRERQDISEMVENMLSKIGVSCKVDVMENATYLDGIVNAAFQMYILTWPTYTGDAEYGLYDTFYSESATWANTCRYNNPVVDELLDQASEVIDPTERAAFYGEIQEILVEESPWVFLWNSEEIAVCRENIDNLIAPPSGRYRLNQVTFH